MIFSLQHIISNSDKGEVQQATKHKKSAQKCSDWKPAIEKERVDQENQIIKKQHLYVFTRLFGMFVYAPL